MSSGIIALVSALLLTSTKAVFEDPRYLLGVPLVLLGALGALLILSPVEEARWPHPQAPQTEPEIEYLVVEGHPTASQYVMVGTILAVVTFVEVLVYYIEALSGALLTILLILSALKFVLVALWFMHLRFDNRIFTVLFAGGLLLVVSLFLVVLSTLGASLV